MWTRFSASPYQCPRVGSRFLVPPYQCPHVDSFLSIILPMSMCGLVSQHHLTSVHVWTRFSESLYQCLELCFSLTPFLATLGSLIHSSCFLPRLRDGLFILLHVHTLLPYHHTLPVIFACFWHLTFVTYRWSNHIKILMSFFTGVEGRQRTREGKRGRGKGSRRTRHYYFDINFCYEIATYCLVLECNAKVGSNSLHLEKWNKNIILWPLHMHTHTCVYKTHTQNLAVTYCTSKIQWQSIKTICFYCLK